ncbi:DUF2383 domain-containing protein [Niallia endozanthoxylica]|uniref:Ferritin-like domain-containing protein n=1 Tax=Niallia endozanthoxylica TaxID=2036016 RepID=A0A5J5HPK1_9BACI|nr:DUF2383 domain-containing protein [Niallia endozanthoxylica]KAA9021768.1 ferritin-like domain-containing protein [Niallia endozanthoxylica]
MRKRVVDELNQFLEGNYMAIHAYENYINHCQDAELKHTLHQFQQEHKQHAQMTADRIQSLGGIPIDHLGLKGTIIEWIKNLTEKTNRDTHIVKDALAGEARGIEVSQKILKNDLDTESKQLVEKILNHDQQHVNVLKKLLQQMDRV